MEKRCAHCCSSRVCRRQPGLQWPTSRWRVSMSCWAERRCCSESATRYQKGTNRLSPRTASAAIRQGFEEKARQAERETLSYEHYLLELAERECQERREHRI